MSEFQQGVILGAATLLLGMIVGGVFRGLRKRK